MEKYPFLLQGVTKSPIWGGSRLLKNWGKTSDAPTVGESWELTVRAKEKSVIANGVYAGKTLEEVLGKEGKNFPLLIKLIDAADRLSVQVHPDDCFADLLEHDRGKTEMWYIVEADENAEIICGLNPGATVADFAKAVEAGDPESVLRHVPVHAGETYFIPAGLTHAIGKGILIAEIQQNCDLTYRVYDYDRRQADGSLRELHVEKALKVIKPLTDAEIAKEQYESDPDAKEDPAVLAACRYFRVEILTFSQNAKVIAPKDGMQHLLCLEGNSVLCCNGKDYPMKKGDSYFLPAGLSVSVTGEGNAVLTSLK